MVRLAIDTVTHVSACPIQIGDRFLQRCLICGEKLADSLDTNMNKFWTEGELVRINHGFLATRGVIYASITSISMLPKDFCLRLVEP